MGAELRATWPLPPAGPGAASRKPRLCTQREEPIEGRSMLAKGVPWAVGSQQRMHRARASQMRWCVSCFLKDAGSWPCEGNSVGGGLLQAEGLGQPPGAGLRLLGGAGGGQVCKGLVAALHGVRLVT